MMQNIAESSDWKFLIPIINYDLQDSHFYISLLYRANNPGVHALLCEKLKQFSLRAEIPQLIEIMLKDGISHPVYELICDLSKRNTSFRVDVFLRARSIISTLEPSKAAYCYYLCCDMLDIDRYENKLNLKGLRAYWKNMKKIKRRILKTGYESNQEVLLENNNVENEDLIENINSEIEVVTKKSNYKNIKFRFHTRTQSRVIKYKAPSLNGLVLYFLRAISSVISSGFQRQVDEYSKIFNNKSNFRLLDVHSSLEDYSRGRNLSKALGFNHKSTSFAIDIHFLLNLVGISQRLKCLPMDLRRLGLIIELEMVNYDIKFNQPHCPFANGKVVKFHIEDCRTLDSAENCPFMVVVEKVSNNCEVTFDVDPNSREKYYKSRTLLNQLNSLNDLRDVGDIDGIQGSILKAIESILFKEYTELGSGLTGDTKSVIRDDEDSKFSMHKLDIKSTTHIPDESNSIDIEFGSPHSAETDLVLLENDPSSNAFTTVSEIGEDYKNNLNIDINIDDESINDGNCDINNNLLPGSTVNENVLKDITELKIDNKESKMTDKDLANKVQNKTFNTLRNRILSNSKFSNLPGWDIKSFIIKSGGIMKQEYIAYQVLTQMKEIFQMENLPIYIRDYQIFLISDSAGMIETVVNSISIHRIKYDYKFKSLSEYFSVTFENLEQAKLNFLHSLVGYSLACYLLQIKDRHNGNILIDHLGHIIHVDFGFILGKYPGILSVENAPFKMATDYLDIIDLEQFRLLFFNGFKILRKNKEKLVRLVEIVENTGYCEKGTYSSLMERLKLTQSDRELEIDCQWMISKSIKNMGTIFYDQFQYFSNGYL